MNTPPLSILRSIDWQSVVNRPEEILCISITCCAYRSFQRVTGLPVPINHSFYARGGLIAYSAQEMAALSQCFRRGGLRALKDFRKRLIDHVGALDALGRKLERTTYVHCAQRRLLNDVLRYEKTAYGAHNFLIPLAVADRGLAPVILDMLPTASETQRQQWLGTLAYPSRENDHLQEERAFLHLVNASQRGRLSSVIVNSHLQKFGWIGARWYAWGNAWTPQDIHDRIRSFQQSGKQPMDALRHIEVQRREIMRARTHLMRLLNVRRSSRLYHLMTIAQSFAYLRTWRTDVVYRSGYRARELFREIARRAGIDPGNAMHCTIDEMVAMARMAKAAVSASELQRRRAFFIQGYHNGAYFIDSDPRWKKRIGYMISISSSSKEKRELSGIPACPGRVRGAVRVVRSAADVSKVERGDILVAVMTFPHFIAAMERAAAFVTDEGGILCHAAIVAREMNKPCIISTKNATRVFRDGDRVEVDANKGTVQCIA